MVTVRSRLMALIVPNGRFRDVAAGEQEPVGIFGELARQPLSGGPGKVVVQNCR